VLDLDYAFTEGLNDPDSLQLRVPVSRDFPEFEHTANLGLKQQLGNNSDNLSAIVSAWQSVY
jgi:hypothetical protein